MSNLNSPETATKLDLRKTKCPLNFVQAKLALEKLPAGHVLEIWLLPGAESAINIPDSLRKEGHSLLGSQLLQADVLQLCFSRCVNP